MHLEEAVEEVSMNDKLQEIVELRKLNENLEVESKRIREDPLRRASKELTRLNDLFDIFLMVDQYNEIHNGSIVLHGTGFVDSKTIHHAYNKSVESRKYIENELKLIEGKLRENRARIRDLLDEVAMKNRYKANKVMFK